MSMPHVPALAGRQPIATPWRVAREMAVPAALYAVALAVTLLATRMVGFPANEGSAYYAAVAGNLAEGRGLVIDAIWSYATPPLTLPRPAFELWQPLASLFAALPMLVLGVSFDAAQLGLALVAALLAPLAWLVARQAATALGLRQPSEVNALALGSAVLVVVSGPVLMAAALPDSTIPFAVAGLAAALALARVLAVGDGSVGRAAFLLGAALGVAWLARHEAIWLAATAVLLAASGGRLTRRFVLVTLTGGAIVVTPWLIRSWLTFGSLLPGQTVDNAFLTANEQIYAYATRPSADAFLAQGLEVIFANIAAGLAHNLLNVLVVPAAPAVIVGLLGGAWLMRRPGMRMTALGAVLLAGGLTFVVASVAFPVASLWGTFQHAAGPLVVGLAVTAVLALDAGVRTVGRRRGWQRRNVWLAPLALVALTLPISLVQLGGLSAEADRLGERTATIAAVVQRQPEIAGSPAAVVISDHPVWLAEATGISSVALPAEPLESVLALAGRFDVRVVAIYDERGEYPALLRTPAGRACFGERIDPALPPGAALFVIDAECLE